MLGEKITATIKAKYYFGSPVTKAKVKYKVKRTSHDRALVSARARGTGSTGRATGGSPTTTPGIPAGGTGAARGRCRSGGRARSSRRNWSPISEVEIGAGRHGEGRDRHRPWPRRSIPTRTTATRSPPRWSTSRAARSSARARCWSPASRSRSTPGSIAATIASATRSTPTSPPARSTASRSQGKGELTLLKITYDKKTASRSKRRCKTWKVDTNAEGMATQQMTASQAGQYRLSYKLTDAKKHTIEGGYLFTDHRRRLRRLAVPLQPRRTDPRQSANTRPARR